MNKTRLNNFITKYHLGGSIETTRWEVTSDQVLKTGFISSDRSLVGYVSMENFKLDESEFAIFTTSDLVKMLDTLDNDIDINLVGPPGSYTSLKINDGSIKMNYALANMKTVNPAPAEKKLPEWDVVMELDAKFIQQYNKSVSALKADHFAVVYDSKRGKHNLVLGHSDLNTNRITFEVDSKHEKEINDIFFNAGFLKEILLANKESLKFTLKVSSAGLAFIEFDLGEFQARYYLIEVPNVN